jgi:apolipoprotein N-acyltransferase
MGWRVSTLVVLVSGALFYLGTGLAPLAGVAVLAPIPVLWLALRAGAWPAAVVAWLAFALGTTNSWVLYVDSVDVPISLAAVIVVSTSLFFAAAVLLFRALALRGYWLLAVLAAPAVHVSGWYLASIFSPAGIMGTLATGQTDVPVVMQVAALTGGWGVDYLVMLVAAAVAVLLSHGTHRLRVVALTGGLVLATLAFGFVRLAGADDEPRYRVALIGDHEKKQWGTPADSPAGQRKLAGYVREIEHTTADLVVLPEGAFAATDTSLSTVVDPLRAAAGDANVVVGVVLNERNNSAVAITGATTVIYDKWHDRGRNIVPGDDLRYLPNTRVGLMVCGDVNFARPFRDYAADGADLVALPASDEDVNGWQHARTALLRGVENGVGVAWAAQRGTMLAADAWGRPVASSETSVHSVTLPGGAGPTVYTRLGDWFAWLCLVVTAIGIVVTIRRKATVQAAIT